MEFRVFAPDPNLQPFLQGYLEADSRESKTEMAHTLFPNGFSGLFFNFGNLGKLRIKLEYATPFVSVFGQIDQSFEAVHWPGSYSLGVLMKPTMLARFFRLNMTELTNRTQDGVLMKKELAFLHEQLNELSTTKEKIALLDAFFLGYFKSQRLNLTLADAALHYLHTPNAGSIREISKQLQVSERHLEKNFRQLVGLSPKTYSMIMRFKRVEYQLQQKRAVAWKDLDFGHEYYDQNHFIKDFKRFTGLTPSDYLLNSFSMGRSYLLR
ncbi:MAG: helix-turn-helix domain-containing protein [Bacteroidota bacterium]